MRKVIYSRSEKAPELPDKLTRTDSFKPLEPSGPRIAEAPTVIQWVGLVSLSLYIVSAYAFDLTLNLLRSKPYLSTISGICTGAAFLLCGKALRPLRTKIGRYWLLLAIWMVPCSLLGAWPGGSMRWLGTYALKIHTGLFFVLAFAFTIRQIGWLIYANIAAAFTLLFLCFQFGALVDGRLAIPWSLNFAGPNDLGLQLVVCMGFFTFLLAKRGVLSRTLGLLGLTAAFYYLLKTSSRGSLAACVAVWLALIVFTQSRWKALALILPCVLLLAVSPGLMHRLTLIAWDPGAAAAQAETDQDQKTYGSQLSRIELMKLAVQYTIRNPVFGVGPGEFADAVWGDVRQAGEWTTNQPTHSAYLQVSSECGVPALYLFVAVIVLSIRSNYRIYKQSLGRPGLDTIHAAAFCLFVTTLGYAVNAFFHHVAWNGSLSLLAGLSAALPAAAQPLVSDASAATSVQRAGLQ